jgi:extradiol dioxygenase family protein
MTLQTEMFEGEDCQVRVLFGPYGHQISQHQDRDTHGGGIRPD